MRQVKKLRALRNVLGHEAFQKNDECVFFCPKCKHRKAKLSVNIKTDYFNCWVCSYKGKNLKSLLFLKGRTTAADEYSKYLLSSRNEQTSGLCVETRYDVPCLPHEFRTLTEESTNPYIRHAFKYLDKRGINRADILRFKLGTCVEGSYKGRIIIPSFDVYGDLNFFVGRKIYDHIGTNYKHGNFDKNIIFNDYLVDWNEPVTLVEGPFDAMTAGDNAIPLQGTILRDDSLLFAKIVTSGVPVYLALDSNVKGKQLKIMKMLLSYGVEVRYIEVEDNGFKDVGEMSTSEFEEMKLNATVITSQLDVLRIRANA